MKYPETTPGVVDTSRWPIIEVIRDGKFHEIPDAGQLQTPKRSLSHIYLSAEKSQLAMVSFFDKDKLTPNDLTPNYYGFSLVQVPPQVDTNHFPDAPSNNQHISPADYEQARLKDIEKIAQEVRRDYLSRKSSRKGVREVGGARLTTVMELPPPFLFFTFLILDSKYRKPQYSYIEAKMTVII